LCFVVDLDLICVRVNWPNFRILLNSQSVLPSSSHTVILLPPAPLRIRHSVFINWIDRRWRKRWPTKSASLTRRISSKHCAWSYPGDVSQGSKYRCCGPCSAGGSKRDAMLYFQRVTVLQNKMLSYRRQTALQYVRWVWLKVEDRNWETIFYGYYGSIFNHWDIIGQQSYRIRWNKRKIRAITPFNVIQGNRGRYQSKACMRLLISD